MNPRSRLFTAFFLLFVSVAESYAEFTSRELFRIPFGTDRAALGAKVEGQNFVFPRDFTIDSAGRFYIYDAKKYRIARFSRGGQFEIGYRYPPTAGRVFAHADGQNNLWVLVTEPSRGLYYGVYDERGKNLREGIFAQYNQFRLHVDDESILHIVVSSTKNTNVSQMYIFDEETHLMKKENIATPPADHHQLRKSDRRYFIDAVPGTPAGTPQALNRITDESRRSVAQIRGSVIYMTEQGEIYTRVGPCELHMYEVNGRLKGKLKMTGLPATCEAIRFDSNGNIYQLDGIPTEANEYTPAMPGMRMMLWQRQL